MAIQITSGRLVAAAAMLGAVAVLALRPPGLNDVQINTLALGIATIGLWASAAIAEHLTAIGFFLVASVGAIASPETIFAGFASTAIWMVFGGMVIGVAVTRTGLAVRLADLIGRLFPPTYGGILSGMVSVAVLLSLLMPSSMGRIVLLVPIATAIAGRFGYQPGSRGHVGIIVATTVGAFLPAFAVLPANVANLVLAGTSETMWNFKPYYGNYLLLHFPVLGLAKAVLIPLVVTWLLPAEPPRARPAAVAQTPMRAEERRLAELLVVALALWSLDFWHGVSPAWVALGTALICLLPGVGCIPPPVFARDVSIGPVLYVAGILGLGAMIADSGLGDTLARQLLTLVPLREGADAANFAALVVTGVILALCITSPAVPVVLTPLAGVIAARTGFDINSVLMLQVVAFSTFLLPYQSPPLVVGLGLAGIRIRDAAKVTLTIAAITVVVLLPADFLWWRLLGWLGP